jgi:hypothetical protein
VRRVRSGCRSATVLVVVQALHVTVASHHDLVDYLAAIGGLVGGIAALAALVFAGLSKRDAARSANAAEATQELADEQVAIMRREAAAAEAERSRRAAPEIHLGARPTGTSADAPPRLIYLTVGFSNENGTRSVERLTVNLRVPDLMSLSSVDGEQGIGPVEITKYPSVELGEHCGALVWSPTIGPIDRHVHLVKELKLGSPPAGTHRIEAELVHPDLPGGQSVHAWTLKVPAHGDRVELEPIPVGQPESRD